MATERHGFIGDGGSSSTPASPKSVADPEAVREQAQRVLSDPLFHNSKRSSSLLRFIVDRTLDGQHDILKERIIGMEVFGRTADYDTSLDATVRVAVTEVRKRLALYYTEPGHSNELRIDIPVRSYVAEFRPPEHPAQEPPAADSQQKFRHWSMGIPIAAAILAVAVWSAARLLSPAPAIDRFWAPVLNSSAPVSILIGSPPLANQAVANAAAKPGAQQPERSLTDFLAESQADFSFSDLSAASMAASFLGLHQKESSLHYDQNTSLSELRENPIILIGGFPNEWAMRLRTDLRYSFQLGEKSGKSWGMSWIDDKKDPANRNWEHDQNLPYTQVTADYALITRVLDQSTGQWMVGIAGLTGMSTLAAQQMLTNPKAMSSLGASLPKGWAQKNLQIVLAFKMVNGSLGTARIVATYSW